jgi:probable F420-dependent oxidoreductase
MKFGVYLPNMMHLAAVTQPWEHSVDAAGIVRVAQLADELGYLMVPVPEHFVIPPAHVEFSGDHYFDATTVQAFLAGATSRITLGSVATILPLHHPIVLAKAIATLDWFSGGRALVTVGVGWLEEEFRALGVPFAKRGRLADEYLAAMFELWHSDSPSFEGEFVSFHDVTFGPKPIRQPHPQIWVGGDADAALRRAARLADGWCPWLAMPAQLPARLDFLRAQPGFGDRPFEVCYSLAMLSIGAEHVPTNDPNAYYGQSAEQVIDQCGTLVDLGVTITSVMPPPLTDLDAYLDHVRWVADEVIPQVG